MTLNQITCTRPGSDKTGHIRITPAPTDAEPARIRLEIEGDGYHSILVDGAALIRATLSTLAELGQRPAVPTATLSAVIDAAWTLMEKQHRHSRGLHSCPAFHPFDSCPECQCGLWPVDEWQPAGDRRCENCGHVVAGKPGDHP